MNNVGLIIGLFAIATLIFCLIDYEIGIRKGRKMIDDIIKNAVKRTKDTQDST